MNKIACLIILIAVMVLSGCATYNTKGTMPIISRLSSEKVVKANKDGINIIVYPIISKEDSEKYFDVDLLRYRVFNERILAVYLDISNNTFESIKVVSADLKVGQNIIRLSDINVAYKAVKREYAGKAILWMLPTYFIGAIPSLMHTSSINKIIENDLKEKNFILNKEIKNLESSQGFIWFRIPEKEIRDGLLLPENMCLNICFLLSNNKEKKYLISLIGVN